MNADDPRRTPDGADAGKTDADANDPDLTISRPDHDTEDWLDAGTDGNSAGTGPQSPIGQFGRYRVLERLGEGGFGSVFRAFDPQLERDVALKFPRGDKFDEAQHKRLLREARAAAALRHPHIVRVYDVGEIDGHWFIASDRIEGKTLRRVLQEQGAMPPREAAQLVAKLASALAYAHGRGVVHRDVKPENVLIDTTGDPHLTDFGLARRDERGDEPTREGVRMGTPCYMSPEQASGRSHQADGRSDLWSLGVVFHELLTGRRPPSSDESAGTADSQTNLAGGSNAVPRELAAICLRCLEPDPNDRYHSGAELADDLRRWVAGNSPSSRSLFRSGPTPRALAAMGVLLAVFVVASCAVWLIGRGNNPLDRVATVGNWAGDQFLKVRLREPVRGTLLADVNYELQFEVVNRTSMRMEFSRIVVDTFNAEVNAAMGAPGDQVHSNARMGTPEQPMHLKPREPQTIPFYCGQSLPKSAIIRFFHSQSAEPSEFRLEGIGVAIPISGPRHLSQEAIDIGSDAIAALGLARDEARRWSNDARLHTAFAPDRRVLHDAEAGLRYVETRTWVAVFASDEKKRGFVVEVNGNQLKTGKTGPGPLCPADLFPQISTQQAVRIADKRDLIRADWNGEHVKELDITARNPRLRLLKTASGWTLVWFLPYLGPDSVPITIDAVTGFPLRMVNGSFVPVK